MQKLIEKLDELFAKYQVSEEEIAEVGDIIAGLGGELNMEGEDFIPPEVEDGSDEDEEGFED